MSARVEVISAKVEVIATEATDSLTVRRAVERPPNFALSHPRKPSASVAKCCHDAPRPHPSPWEPDTLTSVTLEQKSAALQTRLGFPRLPPRRLLRRHRLRLPRSRRPPRPRRSHDRRHRRLPLPAPPRARRRPRLHRRPRHPHPHPPNRTNSTTPTTSATTPTAASTARTSSSPRWSAPASPSASPTSPSA